MTRIGSAYTKNANGNAGPLRKGSRYLGEIRKVAVGSYVIEHPDGTTYGPLPTAAFDDAGRTDYGYATERHYAVDPSTLTRS